MCVKNLKKKNLSEKSEFFLLFNQTLSVCVCKMRKFLHKRSFITLLTSTKTDFNQFLNSLHFLSLFYYIYLSLVYNKTLENVYKSIFFYTHLWLSGTTLLLKPWSRLSLFHSFIFGYVFGLLCCFFRFPFGETIFLSSSNVLHSNCTIFMLTRFLLSLSFYQFVLCCFIRYIIDYKLFEVEIKKKLFYWVNAV